jgi:cyclic beta-1,2-glucan synthetase
MLTAVATPITRLALQIALSLVALAASIGPAATLWQTPSRWRDVFVLTPGGAAIVAVLLLAAVAWSAARTRRALPLAAGLGILALPYLLGLLLLLAASPLMEQLGRMVSGALLSTPMAIVLGRTLVLVAFTETVLLGVGLVMDQRWTRGVRLHAIVVMGCVFAALTPLAADAGGDVAVADWPAISRLAIVVVTAALSQAGLWALTFFLTGVMLDALRDRRPTQQFSIEHWRAGLVRGAIYGGVFMFVVQIAAWLLAQPELLSLLAAHPVIGGAILAAIVFPFGKTILESFDGSAPFFRRLAGAVLDPRNYLRGALAGGYLAHLIVGGLPENSGTTRFVSGFLVGALAYAGADLVWDLGAILLRKRRHLHSWRVYALGAALGGFVAGALTWYFDAAQLGAVITKFWSYAAVNFPAAGKPAAAYVVYPLFSKWGAIDLGVPGGGVRLFYSESLSGVINWSLAAPLFGLNLVALNAVFQRSLEPLRELFSGAGAASMVEQTVRVLRWGLWMAPIIYTFLRLAPDPTWYNQDGAIRTVAATVLSWSLSPEDFRAWSLSVFLGLLAYDWLRVLVWFDHLGLRVATLVNLSFVGGDALDEKAAKFIGHSGRTRGIPEGIRRFLTWAPLLIPFYLPRGAEWDHVWSRADLIHDSAGPMLPAVAVLTYGYRAAAIVLSLLLVGFVVGRWRRWSSERAMAPPPMPLSIGNGLMTAELHEDGRGYSRVLSTVRAGYVLDLTRRPDDPLQLRGKFFYLRELDDSGQPSGPSWSLGREPRQVAGPDYRIRRTSPTSLQIVNSHAGVRIDAEVALGEGSATETWRLRLHNLESRPRKIELTSFQELALSGVDAYRRSPPFAAIHVGTWFFKPLNAIVYRNRLLRDAEDDFRRQRMSREVGYHCARLNPSGRLTGYEDSRSWFLGSGTPRAPAALDGRAIRSPDDEGLLYSFDPAASLRLEVALDADGIAEVEFLDGYATDLPEAIGMIAAHVGAGSTDAEALAATLSQARRLHVPEVQEPPYSFSDDGTELHAQISTPRPWTHVLANRAGHGAVISNEGEIFSFAGNAQQNALTPFQLDTVPALNPGQAIYVVDLETKEIDTPGFVPHRRADASHEATFGRGYATLRKKRGDLELELTCFVLVDQPVEVKLLRIRNRGTAVRRLRIVPYAEIVLGEVPVDTMGAIDAAVDDDILFFANPGNDFHQGWAFAATSLDCDATETSRPRVIGGAGHDLANPHFVEHGVADATQRDDGRRVAAFAGTIEIGAGGDARVTFLLGQAPDRESARKIVEGCRDPVLAQRALIHVQHWWDDELSVLRIESNWPQFDRMVNDWLPYQLLCSRLWGRAGPSQRGGAFGFRDQLQDVLPLLFTRPDLARSQIVLHAAQQFIAGDVVKWWHPSSEGKTGVAVRTMASDPQLWLPYVVTRYVAATGDHAVLDERASFLEGRTVPPGQEGVMFVPRRSREEGTVYEHCRRAIEWSLARLGARGIPLLGSGDWNDGIDVAGIAGRGESGWLGFFLYDVLVGFAPIAQRCEGNAAWQRYLDAADKLRLALEGLRRTDTYVRAITDDGEEMTAAGALMAAWPALSDAVSLEVGLAVLEANLSRLEKDDRVLLAADAFTESSRPYPGRLADYPPGVRENGGQYSHGASWIVDAFLRCADLAEAAAKPDLAQRCRDRAAEIWVKISALSKVAPEKLGIYGLPPHQQPADVYDGPGYEGRGGWSWYTGAAARMLSAAYALVGLSMENGELKVAPHAFTRKGGLQLKRVEYRGHTFVGGA